MQNVIVDIRRLCEELLDKNVDSIKKLTIGNFFFFNRSSYCANSGNRTRKEHQRSAV